MATSQHPSAAGMPFRADAEAAAGAGATPLAPVLCFLAGLAVLLPIAPESRLTLFDVVACWLVLRYWPALRQRFRTVLILLAVGLSATAASAVLNGSAMTALLGRAYAPLVLVVEMLGYWVLIASAGARGRALLVVGTMVGICCHYFYPTDERVADDAIKFLLGIPLGAGLIALYAFVFPRGTASVVPVMGLMIAYAIFCFLVGSRSIGGVYFASALLVGLAGILRLPGNYARIAPFLIIGVALSGYALTELYTYLAIRGTFGDRAAGIAAFQSSFGSILLGGRPEILVNLVGIGDSPLTGVGIGNYPTVYLYEMISLQIYSAEDVIDTQNILYHSILFGTAFESGIPSAILWGYLLYVTLFCLPLLIRVAPAMRAYMTPLMVVTVWHLIYSPPIPYNRFVLAIALAFILNLYMDWKRQLRAQRAGE